MQKVRIGLAVTVTVVWLAGYIVSYVGGSEPPVELSGLMAVVLGWAFAGQVRVSLKRKDDDDERR